MQVTEGKKCQLEVIAKSCLTLLGIAIYCCYENDQDPLRHPSTGNAHSRRATGQEGTPHHERARARSVAAIRAEKLVGRHERLWPRQGRRAWTDRSGCRTGGQGSPQRTPRPPKRVT